MSRDPSIQSLIDRPPGHARVLGPPGSGKTTLLVERYRALTKRGHRPGVIAFGRAHSDRLLERIIPPGNAHLGAPPVTTHALVASAVLDAARPRRPRTLRDVDELLLLGRLVRREPELLASDLAAISGSATFLRHLLDALHALAQNGVSSDTARASAKRCANSRACDVLAVYARHRDVCAERGLVSFYDAAWRAAECVESGGAVSPLAEFDVVLIDDFHDLDPGQYHLLTRLIPRDGRTHLEVFGDPTGARFSFRGTSDGFLMERFPKDYAPENFELSTPNCTDEALCDTIASLIGDTSAVPAAVSGASALPLFATAPVAREAHTARPAWNCAANVLLADDDIAEAQAIAARVRNAIDAGTPPHQIAVVTRDADRYRAVLELACHEWGVPLDAGGQENRAAHDFLRSLVGALGSDSDGRFAEALAASPLYPPLCGGQELEPLRRAFERDYASKRQGFQLDRLLAERVAPLVARDDDASRAVLVAVTDEWHRYKEVVEHGGGGATLDEFRVTYLAERSERAPAGNRVALLSAREASGRSFHTVFVCGCAEGVFPGSPARDGYIPLAALARALERDHPDAAHAIAERLDDAAMERAENALFLTVLTRATDTLVISTPARVGGEAVVPPRVLEIEARGFTTEEAPRVPSPCTRAAYALAGAKPDAASVPGLRALDPLAGWWATPTPEARYPATPGFKMSASKLNSYARCARQFFYRNVLKINEPESIYLRVGSLVHEAL